MVQARVTILVEMGVRIEMRFVREYRDAVFYEALEGLFAQVSLRVNMGRAWERKGCQGGEGGGVGPLAVGGRGG